MDKRVARSVAEMLNAGTIGEPTFVLYRTARGAR